MGMIQELLSSGSEALTLQNVPTIRGLVREDGRCWKQNFFVDEVGAQYQLKASGDGLN